MIYKCVIQYDGSRFSGWQKQPGEHTVQQSIEEALSIIHKQAVSVHGSGRTDKGVHALGQVFHFESDLNMDGDSYRRALNALLPKTTHITSVKALEGFHARFDALSKTYTYIINMGDLNVFKHDYEYQLCRKLDVDAMIDATRVFIGEHDFTSYNATELNIVKNQVRQITKLDIISENDILTITIEGDGFLRYMVRMIVAALVEVGLHRLTKENLQDYLDAQDKDVFTKNVPSCGLYLMNVNYND